MLLHNKQRKTHKREEVFRKKYPKIANLESTKWKQYDQWKYY